MTPTSKKIKTEKGNWKDPLDRQKKSNSTRHEHPATCVTFRKKKVASGAGVWNPNPTHPRKKKKQAN